MNLDREILLPLNFSKMRPCTPILHPDDYISLVCSFVSGQSTNEDLRLDFNSTYHTVTKRGGSMFLWDANDSLVNFLPLNGTLQGSNLSIPQNQCSMCGTVDRSLQLLISHT